MEQRFTTRTAWIPNRYQVFEGGSNRTLSAYYDPAVAPELLGPPPALDLVAGYYDVVIQQEANVGIRWKSDGENTERWEVCEMCGWEFPQSQTMLFQGKRYCVPRGHGQIAINDARRKQGK